MNQALERRKNCSEFALEKKLLEPYDSHKREEAQYNTLRVSIPGSKIDLIRKNPPAAILISCVASGRFSGAGSR
jgi:hypothetical protein